VVKKQQLLKAEVPRSLQTAARFISTLKPPILTLFNLIQPYSTINFFTALPPPVIAFESTVGNDQNLHP